MVSRFMLCIALVPLSITSTLAQDVADPLLREQLLSMDERVRRIGEEASQHAANLRMDEMVRAMAQLDSLAVANARAVERILQTSGWPGFDRVGEDGSAIAFDILIARKDDKAFEPTLRLALSLMEGALAVGDVDAEDYAVLFDTLRLADEGSQWYGTQVSCLRESARDGTVLWTRCEPWPIAEDGAVDDRRAELGLDTIEEYIRRMKSQL